MCGPKLAVSTGCGARWDCGDGEGCWGCCDGRGGGLSGVYGCASEPRHLEEARGGVAGYWDRMVGAGARSRLCPSGAYAGGGRVMPKRALRPCRVPGCPELVGGGGYCSKHTPRETARTAEQRRSCDRRRGTSSERGYDARHRRWRLMVLRRDPVCRMCRREPSSVADHIRPIRRGHF